MSDLKPLGVSETLSLDELVDHICRHSDLVQNAGKVFGLAQQLDCTVDDLRAVIQSDPVLAAHVVRRVNSAYYGLSQPVDDLRQATSVLGFYDLRNLTLVSIAARFLDQHVAATSINRSQLWQHSLGVAAAGHLLARVACKGNPADVFAAGVIHDIGYILLDLYHRRPFQRVLARSDGKRPLCEIEQDVLGFDHAELGARLAEVWHLPETVSESVRYHHTPEQYIGPHRESVYVLTVANYFCWRGGWSSIHGVPVSPPPDCAYAGLELDSLALSIFWDEFPGVLDRSLLLAEA